MIVPKTRGELAFLALLAILSAALRSENPGTPEPPTPTPTAEAIARVLDLEDRRQVAGGELVALTLHPEPEVRARAARALGCIQDPTTIDALAALLADADTDVRFEAIFALGQMFDLRASLPLQPFLDAPEVRLREAAVLALAKTGDRNVTPRLLERLGDEHHSVRAAVPLACSMLQDQNATTKLCEHFAREVDPHVRWRIVYCLARLQDERAKETLITALEDKALPLIRSWAAHGLRPWAEEPEVTRALLTRVEDTDLRVVVSLLSVVERSPRCFDLEDVESLAAHPSFHVRTALARAGAAVGGEGAAAMLERLRADESVSVRAAATEALPLLLDQYAMPLISVATLDDHWQVRAAAVRGYASIKVGKALANLVDLFRDPDPRVQTAVVQAIGARLRTAARPEEIELREDALRVLLEALEIDDLAVRGTAAEVLLELKVSSSVEPLLRALDSWKGRDTFELRETLARGLGSFGGEACLPVLTRLLEDEFTSVRAAAAESIAAITGEPEPPYDETPGPTDDPEAPLPPEPLPPGAQPQVVLKTARGEILIELYPDDAPRHVARFLQSVERELYDGLSFHRVVSDFVVQGGDPLGHGWGDAGFSLRDEINPRPYMTGTVGMPKAGKDTGGCQLFITHSPQPRLDGHYTVFGGVLAGMDVVNALEVGDRILSIRRTK